MKDINLLPNAYRNQTNEKHHVFLLAAVAGILIISVIYFTYSFYQLTTIEKRNEASIATLNKLNGTTAPITKEEKRAVLAREFGNENRQTSNLIKTTFVKAPPDINIIRITGLETSEINISGTGKANRQITQYTEDLKRSQFFKTLTIKFIRESGSGNFQFELQGSY